MGQCDNNDGTCVEITGSFRKNALDMNFGTCDGKCMELVNNTGTCHGHCKSVIGMEVTAGRSKSL